MAELKKILVSMPDSLLEDVDSLASSDGVSRSEMIREAMREYIRGRKKREIREQLKKGYEEMAAYNAEWAEACLAADNETLQLYEEKISECE